MATTLADDTFKYRFVNENITISIKFSLKLGPYNGLAPTRGEAIVWNNVGFYLHIYTALILNELNM